MRSFKSFDFYAQLILIVLATIAMLLQDENLGPLLFIFPFAVLQVISIIVHFAWGSQPWKNTLLRKIHLTGTFLILGGMAFALFQGSAERTGDKDDKYSSGGLGTLLALTIPAILFGLFYTIITFVEWRKMKSNERLKV